MIGLKIIDSILLTEDVTLVVLTGAPSDIGFVADVFEALSRAEINVDMISQSPPSGLSASLAFTISGADLTAALREIASLREVHPGIGVGISSDNCKISVSGEALRSMPGIAAKTFRAAASVGTDIRLITTSEIDISMLVTKAAQHMALEAIEAVFET